MNYKRIGRALICLVLVCALLVNVSPIKAEAVAVESALGIGLAACLILASCGMIYTGLTQNEIIGVGNAFQAHILQAGAGAGILDAAEEFLGGLTLFSGSGSGSDDDDSDFRFSIPKALASIIAGFTAGAIAAGSLNVENKLEAEEGHKFYGEVSLSEIISFGDYPYSLIAFDDTEGLYRLVLTKKPCDIYLNVYNNKCYYGPNSACYIYVYSNGSWEYRSSSNMANNAFSLEYFPILWSGYDILYEGTDTVYLAGSEPSSISITTVPVLPETYVGDIPSGIQGGTITEENLSIPEIIDYSAIAAANPDLATGVMDYLGQVANGTVTYEDMIATIAPTTDNDTEVVPPDVVVPDIPAISDALGDTTTSVFLNALADTIETLPLIPTHIEDAIEQLPAYISDIRDYIETLPQWQDTITDYIEQLPGQIADIRDYIETLPEWQDNLLDHIEILPDRFSTAFDDVKTGIGTIADTLTGSITGTLTDIKAIGVDIGTKVQAIPDAIAKAASDAKAAVVEAVEAAVIPEKDYLTAKVRALQEEFAFADSIVRTGEALQLGLAGISTTPPVIYIYLGDTEGSYNIGGTVPFLDLRWYARYKPTVDTLISAFLWICFVWRMLVKLPGIISGMPGDFVMASAHQMGVAEHLPTRSKEYEIQRISNRETIRKGLDK